MLPPQLLIVLLWLGSRCGQQFYDRTDCSSAGAATQATEYTCAAAGKSCRTFVVYRANPRFSTVAAISTLFQADPDVLLAVNTNVSIPTEVLAAGHEVLVPIACSCGGDRVYRSYFNYSAADSLSISEIACAVYEGLVKSAALAAANPAAGGGAAVPVGSTLQIPVKCACLDNGKDEEIYIVKIKMGAASMRLCVVMIVMVLVVTAVEGRVVPPGEKAAPVSRREEQSNNAVDEDGVASKMDHHACSMVDFRRGTCHPGK